MVDRVAELSHLHAVPPVSDRLVRRDRVIRVLDEARAVPVLCLQAPGGYGKTTALAQWLAGDPRPVVWLSVRPGAADAPWLAYELVNELADRELVSRRLPGSPSTDPVMWHLRVLPFLEEAVSRAVAPFVVAIDDAGALSGTTWECLIESLASSLPPGAQVVMTTREAVPATLWRLQSRGDVRVVGPEVLALDDDETEKIGSLAGVPLTSEQVRMLREETEGWPVAVYLCALSWSSGGQWSPVSATIIGGNVLAGHLCDDVVGRLDEDDAEFLSRCSVLNVLDPEACDAVASTTGSLTRLRRLSAANHLLSPEGETGDRFRMHRLMADALSERLRERPEAWRGAHGAASHIDERRGDLDSAIFHAKHAGDDDRLAELIWSHAPHMLATGQWTVLVRWLGGLDDDRLMSRCRLALSASWAASHFGDMPRVSRFALAAAETAAHGDAECLLDVDLLAATIGAHGLEHVEASARAFVDGKPPNDPWQTLAHFLLGVSLFLRDESDQAMSALLESRRIASALGLPVMEAHALAALGDVALIEGREHQAVSWIWQARELATRYQIDTIATTAPIFTTSAVCYLHEGRYADARQEAARALRLTALMRMVAPWHALQGRLALAQVNVALGDADRARVLFDEAGDARGPHNSSPRLDRLYEEVRGQVSTIRTTLDGASSLTTAEVRVLQYLPTHLSFPQIAAELFVSRHTVKTQAMSVYRKFGVHTRSEAIERARRAGLLPAQ